MPMSAPCKYLVVAVAAGLIVFTLQEADAQLPSSSRRYMIVHRQSNKVLASSSITSPGTLTLTDRDDSISQQWILREIGSYYTITNNATGLYLDGDGSAAYTHTFIGNNHQQWSIIFVCGVWFRLEQRQTGNVLDGDGTSVYMQSYNGGDFQQWRLHVTVCGALTNPPNGRVTYIDGTGFGQTATYSCNTGYNLVGDSTRTCQLVGWFGSEPTCQSLNCGNLTDPANGQVSHTAGTTFGQTATYSCNTGYNLVGDSNRTCQATGNWSGSAPICQVLNCGTLTNPANGQVSHTAGTTLGQTATYSCNTGYRLVGGSTRTCQSTGVWSGSVPTCQVVDCGTLTNPANSQVSYTGRTTFGQTATYSCNAGYNLVGNSTRTCDGVWSGSEPTCQAMDCDTLTDPANGQVSHTTGTTLGQTATYSCNIGYNLMGGSIRTCQATGWSGSVPTCQAVDCGTLNNPANGQVSYTGRTTFGQTATYSCDAGYNLVGNSIRTCQATGVWSGSAPTCQDLEECISSTHTYHVNATCNNTQGSYTCSCNIGYTGNGFSCTASNTSTTSTQDNLPLVIGVVVSIAGVLMVITTALIIVSCVMMKRRQALKITTIFTGNEASMNNLGEQMDTEIKEPADYEIPDPPSMMRMKENEAYGPPPAEVDRRNETSLDTQGEQMDTEIKGESVYEVPDPPSMMRMKENEAYGPFPN